MSSDCTQTLLIRLKYTVEYISDPFKSIATLFLYFLHTFRVDRFNILVEQNIQNPIKKWCYNAKYVAELSKTCCIRVKSTVEFVFRTLNSFAPRYHVRLDLFLLQQPQKINGYECKSEYKVLSKCQKRVQTTQNHQYKRLIKRRVHFWHF